MLLVCTYFNGEIALIQQRYCGLGREAPVRPPPPPISQHGEQGMEEERRKEPSRGCFLESRLLKEFALNLIIENNGA